MRTHHVWYYMDGTASVIMTVAAMSRIMMTSSKGTVSAILALCEGNPPGTSGFPSQRQRDSNDGLDVVFYFSQNKRQNKQTRRRWLETHSHSLWRHSNNWLDCWYMYNIPWLRFGTGNISVTLQSLTTQHGRVRKADQPLVFRNSFTFFQRWYSM